MSYIIHIKDVYEQVQSTKHTKTNAKNYTMLTSFIDKPDI